MSTTDDKPIILSKRKNVQTVIDYCLEQKISFSANPRAISIDEWEVELNINSIKAAIALGMFVRENKLDMYGMGETIKPKTTTANNSKKAETKEVTATPTLNELVAASPAVEEAPAPPTLTFDLNTSNN